MQNYELLLDRIAKSSGLGKEEVERKVEAKKAKLSGLISKEGAAQIIAAELGISFEEQDLKISELMPGMKKVNIVGKIVSLYPVRSYEKNGRSGKVANFFIADETGSVRVVLWDVNHIALLESGEMALGDVVEVKNGSTRDSEIHLSGFSEIKKSTVIMDTVQVTSSAGSASSTLEEAKQGQRVKVRGLVVSLFPPRFYMVCPTCSKKVVGEAETYRCAEHGVVSPKKRAILNFVLDDGTENMRVVMFSEQINSIVSEDDLQDAEKAEVFRQDFLGSEVHLSGTVKRNQLFNNLEIVADAVSKVDVDALAIELER